ncbi:hypothetical protein QE361_003516 [Sphingomonas sp. SORGH_AS802]|jgi:hypothetical protein|uniref:hypothetical protein n=1 Tax=unclassified Sphingomonas TaxID=196159 RepID=UPI000F7F3EFC|nr:MULTISPECIES: hypothetical protein [unclassified Sphingomonas]MDR6125990.1 hypothetical protein [Sphingomonas sp. SORGH_AS_0438]MDR6136509.1 hypothetical protein [Sphingomonas sp. SORGH_AS_0802]RSU45950.1 hypothetical protein BRX43_17045 [Sphingomonas sp. S-NIH.Pt15_0812]
MTGRDLQWRAGGFALLASSCAMALMFDGSPAIIIFFPLALLGLPLMIHGKRVGQLIRAERRGHRETAHAVHAARVRRRRHGDPRF